MKGKKQPNDYFELISDPRKVGEQNSPEVAKQYLRGAQQQYVAVLRHADMSTLEAFVSARSYSPYTPMKI